MPSARASHHRQDRLLIERPPPVGGGRSLVDDDRERLARLAWAQLRRIAAGEAQCHAVGMHAEPSPAGLDPLSVMHWRPRVSVTTSPSVVALVRAAIDGVRAAHGGAIEDGQAVSWMLLHFAKTHAAGEIIRKARRHAAMQRDRWLCQMPHCRRMATLHEHHRRFRSAGGSDDLWNLVTLCDRCHALVHAGKVSIRGSAPDDLTFVLGTTRGLDPTESTYRQEVRVRMAA